MTFKITNIQQLKEGPIVPLFIQGTKMINVVNFYTTEDKKTEIVLEVEENDLRDFAKIGILKVLEDALEQQLCDLNQEVKMRTENEVSYCNSTSALKRCDSCDCWENTREYCG